MDINKSNIKMCLVMMVVICNKQHISNIWIWLHEKVNQHLGWVYIRRCLLKKHVFQFLFWKIFYFKKTEQSNLLPFFHQFNLKTMQLCNYATMPSCLTYPSVENKLVGPCIHQRLGSLIEPSTNYYGTNFGLI